MADRARYGKPQWNDAAIVGMIRRDGDWARRRNLNAVPDDGMVEVDKFHQR
jgi:hypothetical protein